MIFWGFGEGEHLREVREVLLALVGVLGKRASKKDRRGFIGSNWGFGEEST